MSMPLRPSCAITPADRLAAHWKALVVLFWVATAIGLVAYKWNAIHWLALGDTDDNIRFAQVRDWVAGQGWYDLRQHRLNPPGGFNIHWSRFCDLFIAGLYLGARLFAGAPESWRFAAAVAPMLPLALAMTAVALIARRLIDPRAVPLALAALLCAQTALLMFMPLRIDHHGWQLALLLTSVAGLADPRPGRGGITVALASACALAIGLETLPYIGFAGAAIALRWAWDAAEVRRMRRYGAVLAAATALAFVAFASNDNRRAVCDALSPVWLTVAVAGGGGLAIASLLPLRTRALRLCAVLAVGAAVAALYILLFPQCLQRLEGISPELERLWLSNVREAKPIYQHPWRTALTVATLPVMGMIGAAAATWRARHVPDRLAAWGVIALFSWFATALLLWQTRAGPSAQLLAVPGVAALGWAILPRLAAHRLAVVRVVGTVAVFFAITALFVPYALRLLPAAPEKGRPRPEEKTARLCPTLPALRAIAAIRPVQTIFTFIDLGPRLVAMTPQRAVAGPYHRNGAAILDVQHAFRGSPGQARAIIARHGATLLLTCPGMAEATVYQARAKHGFYAELARGHVPAWLRPVPLPKGSPFRLWRVAD